MIKGAVNTHLEATVSLDVRGPGGRSRIIDAVIDTGFTHYLTLPLSQVRELGLPYRDRGEAVMANGALETFDIYGAELLWDGQLVAVLVDEAETTPLVGMALLEGHRLQADVERGGRVLIESLVG